VFNGLKLKTRVISLFLLYWYFHPG